MIRFFFKTACTVLPLAAIILLIAQVVVSNHLVSAGKSSVGLDEEIAIVRSSNDELRKLLATATSFVTIERKAEELGMIKTASILTLAPPDVAYHLR